MQRIDKNGLTQELEAFNEGKMQKWLKDENTDHVDVFEGTKENIETRKKMIGKPFNYKVSRGFKKAPSIKSKKK